VSLPAGTVTFLFTDIEGSTRLLEALGPRYGDALEAHRKLLRKAIEEHAGKVIDMEGDSSFAVFQTARGGVLAAASAQRALAAYDWPGDRPVRVRMGVHSGEGTIVASGYLGMDVHRGARIMSAAHGGQVLISEATRHLLGNTLDERLGLRDLGQHRLKDLTALRLHQLLIPGLQSEFPALKSLEQRLTNLPVQATPLVGRQRELDETGEILTRDDVRLLTLTGVGGTGKTRLALQLAADELDRFPDGVYFVDLAAVDDPELVIPTIARVIAIRELGAMSLEETLSEYLRGRRMLLVLDNFEQVVAGGPRLVALLASAAGLKLLVTSRAPLRLSGEHEYAVPPLGVPDVSQFADLDALSASESVSLFVERARAIRADFALSSENASAVGEICIRLDGLPLAIELAAARIRALSPQALLTRLDERLKVLTGGMRDVPARQRTLRAAIDWSHDLLNDDEQRIFRRLAVFEGRCDLRAAEGVCSFNRDLTLDVLDGLTSLLEESLIREAEEGDGEPLYSMLETIREYAWQKLREADEASTARRRHAEFFLAFAERTERLILGDEPWAAGADERMAKEVPNLRAALEWAFQEAAPEFCIRLVAAARWALGLSGTLLDLESWALRARDMSMGQETVERGRILAMVAESRF
jgi:predicted ATPase/class 3 adenylate cyclase